MKVHFYLEENETGANITNFDIAREVFRLCEDGHFDIQTILTMIQAQVDFNNKEKF